MRELATKYDADSVPIQLKARARRARVTAWLSVVVIMVTVFTLITVFYRGGSTYQELMAIAVPRIDVAHREERDPEIRKKLLDLEIKRAEARKYEAADLLLVFAEGITKIGAVVIALYLVQILVGISRYHFRMADHLDAAAEALILSAGDHDFLRGAMAVVAASHIDFGKLPATPIEKILDLVRDIGRKK